MLFQVSSARSCLCSSRQWAQLMRCYQGHMLPKGARSFKVTVNLAVGKEKAKCWRNEVYAEDRAHPFLPLGRLANLLDTKFVWEDGTAIMQCRDKGKWRTTTKFESRNNMAYASQMQFEVLRRALWVQQAQPQTVFNWQFWERAAQDPKMTSYLTHGVKAKMCETTPFVNTVGAHYVASRAQIEQACDSRKQQGNSKVLPLAFLRLMYVPPRHWRSFPPAPLLRRCSCLRVQSGVLWSCTLAHSPLTSCRIFIHIMKCCFSCKPHRPGTATSTATGTWWCPRLPTRCDCWRYLDAKYYQYDPAEICDICDYNCNATYLAESDQVVTLTAMETDESSMLASIHDNFRELESTVPEREKETQTIHPKWLEHHQSGHLTKDPGCPVCMEEAGSKVNHRRKKTDRHPGIMHCDLAAFEASTDGHKYCLVAAVTIEVDHESKLLPFFVPMPKKDAVCATAALKEALTMCENRNLHQITGSRIVRIQADGGGEFHQPESSESMLGQERNVVVLSSSSTILQWHSRANGWHAQDHSSPNAEAGESRERMVVVCMSICRSYDEREGSRKRMALSSIWSAGWNMEVPWQSTGKVPWWSRAV